MQKKTKKSLTLFKNSYNTTTSSLNFIQLVEVSKTIYQIQKLK